MLTLVHDNPDFKPWRFHIRKARELAAALRDQCIDCAEAERKFDGRAFADALIDIQKETTAALDAGVPEENHVDVVWFVDAVAGAWAAHLKRHIELAGGAGVEPVLVMPVACNLTDVLLDVLLATKSEDVTEI